MRCLLIISLLTALTPCVRAGVDAQSATWGTRLHPALAKAREAGRPVLVLFTLGSGCPNCAALESEVFESDAWADVRDRYVTVRVPYRAPSKMTREHRVLMASARLQVYPTLYVLDAEGWPCFVRKGFDSGDGKKLLVALEGADPRRPTALRKKCTDGYRELLTWYRTTKMELGETLALAALWPKGTASQRLAWASKLIGPAIAREGRQGGAPYLAVLERGDPCGSKGLLIGGLLDAGRQLLRVDDVAGSLAEFRRAAGLVKAPVGQRTEAHVYLAHAFEKRGAPCRAIEELDRAIAVGGNSKDPHAQRFARFARKKRAMVRACCEPKCVCDAALDR